MTNKDKFLKDGVSVEELADKLTKKIQSTEKYGFYDNFVNDILIKFFKAKDIPTLTEDERVILRNIKKEYKFIRRLNGVLWLEEDKNYDSWAGSLPYAHLFQFIKERRRI